MYELRYKALTNDTPYMRIREGHIRIKYTVDDGRKVVTIARVRPRDDVYKRR